MATVVKCYLVIAIIAATCQQLPAQEHNPMDMKQSMAFELGASIAIWCAANYPLTKKDLTEPVYWKMIDGCIKSKLKQTGIDFIEYPAIKTTEVK